MFIKEKYRNIGRVNLYVQQIIDKCDGLWDIDTSRQDKFGVHKDTKSIILRSSPFNGLMTEYSDSELLPEFIKMLQPFFKKVNEEYKYEYLDVNKLIIANLPAGRQIMRHKDQGVVFRRANRVHWALKTTNDVHFFIDDERLPFRNGQIIEISNVKPHTHYVINNSREDRYHIIADFFNNAKHKNTIIQG